MDAFWQEQLEASMAQVREFRLAISSLLDGTIQSYQLDTGQTRTLVTKQQMSPVYLAQRRAMAEVAELQARVCGAGARVFPGF